jgi:hypothetical protein
MVQEEMMNWSSAFDDVSKETRADPQTSIPESNLQESDVLE